MAQKTSVDHIVKISGGVVALMLLGWMFLSYRYFDAPAVGCMDAYAQSARFDLQSEDGLPLSMIELQARAGQGELGLMQNASVVNLDNGPSAAALEVKLGRADSSNAASPVGVHFAWRPVGIVDARSACLRYSVRLPDRFDFTSGGMLPGFFGGATPDRSALADDKSFAMRLHWTKEAGLVLFAQSKALGESGQRVVSRVKDLRLKTGSWLTIEQELVLNTAKANNSQLKVWVDGKLVTLAKGFKIREDDGLLIDGVAATVAFDGSARDTPSDARGSMQITPIEIGWR